MNDVRQGTELPPFPELVLLDADYTCTKPTARGEINYVLAFTNTLQEALGELDPSVFSSRWHLCEGRVHREVGKHGFIFDINVGIVASAESDIMMGTHAIGWALVREFYPTVDHQTYRQMAYRAYKAAYPALGMTVVPELRLLLRGLAELHVPAMVVTNSSAEAVRANLAAGLGDEFPEFLAQIEGNASKFEISPEGWKVVEDGVEVPIPSVTRFSTLAYPVQTRRSAYYEAIKRCRARAGRDGRLVPRDRVLVVGDNPQLDLVLAAELGMQVALVESDRTSPWDRAWIRRIDHAGWRTPIQTLDQILRFLRH